MAARAHSSPISSTITGEEPPADAEAAFKALDLDLTLEEQEKKSQILTDTKGKIKRWFSRQRPGSMAVYGNPFFTYLAQMHRQEDEPPPKRQTDFHFYLRHPNYKDAVAEHFEKLHSNKPQSST
ncbi:hypothetical protein B0H13DRAFT_2351955 [Mycena leptocephala]|nr:hypothetical protein B0H13DRAFT_2351955 [Mycena leptocephala]